MIGKLKGQVDSLGEDHLILEVGGVGYHVFASSRTLSALPRGAAASLLIETHVREDHIHLYGFATAAERDWFRLLTTVQGVGSRHALSVLSVLGPEELARALAAQDKAALTRAAGVGPKLAQRMVSELKEKAGSIAFGRAASAPGEVPQPDGGAIFAAGMEDAVLALVGLGYRRGDAFTAVAEASRKLGDGAALPELIKGGLRELAR